MPAQRKVLLSFLIASVIFLFLPRAIFAASITLSEGQSQLSSPDAEYAIDAVLSISVSDGTIYYLRGVFYKPGTTNYCGYTWNESSWFKGPYSTNEGWKNFLEITTQSASWSGQLKAKLDIEDTGCQNSGIYNFKIQRFTQNGSGTFDSQNEQSVEVIIPMPTPTLTSTPTPTPTLTPTSTPTSKPTPTVKPPTPTPTKKIASPTPTSKTKKPTPTLSGEVLGEGGEATTAFYPLEATEEAEKTPEATPSKKSWLPKLFLVLGSIILFGVAFSVWYNFLREKNIRG